MIASLRGEVLANSGQQVVIDVSGVGYQVFVTANTASQFANGESVFVHTVFVVREDAFSIFGFLTLEELELFNLLRSVTGVGPKSALAILSSLSSEVVASAIALEDDAIFKKVSGIGPKTAKLIVVTLAGKLAPAFLGSSNETRAFSDTASIVTALQGLGWSERASSDAVADALQSLDSSAGVDLVLKHALAALGKSKVSK